MYVGLCRVGVLPVLNSLIDAEIAYIDKISIYLKSSLPRY